MKNYIINSLLLLLLAFLLVSCWNLIFKARQLQTYSINGQIEVVNECTPDPPPASVQVIFRLYYQGSTTPDMTKIEDVQLIGGVGNYNVADVPTYSTGDKWELSFANICDSYNCTAGNCKNTATNTSTTIRIRGPVTNYDYRFLCICGI